MAALRLASALALGAVPCLSTTPAQAQKKNEVVVLCQDEKERPVADVEVHLFQRRKLPDGRGDYRPFGPYRTDAKGQVRCPTAVTFDGERYDRLVYARIPDRLVGGGRSVWTGSGTRDGSLVKVRLVGPRACGSSQP